MNCFNGSADSDGGAMIRVRSAEGLPADLEDGILECLASPGLSLEVRRTPGGPYAAAEAYIPTAVMVFVAAGYFNGFLKKVGEDHYETLKAALRRLWGRASAVEVKTVTSRGEKPATLSPDFSITVEDGRGGRVSLRLRSGADEAEAARAIEAFMDLARRLQNATADAAVLGQARPSALRHWTVPVTFDPATGEIIQIEDGPGR